MSNLSPNLEHHGIKGMKWGVRRKRNSKTGRVESSDSKTARRLKKKRLSEMSNEELAKLNKRMQLERQYKQLKAGSQPGKQFVAGVMKESGKNIASKYVAKAGEAAIASAIKATVTRSSNPSPTKPFRSTSSIKIKKKP